MFSPVLNRIRRTPQRWLNRFEPGGLILMYHRITDARPDPWGICVSPRNFAEQMQVLHEQFRVVPLPQITEAVAAEKPSPFSRRVVAVTFDDGYADNLYMATPILQDNEIPATIFITTGDIGSNREMWWDELEKILLHPGVLPQQLELKTEAGLFRYDLRKGAIYDEAAFYRDQQWNALGIHDPSSRHALFRALYDLLQPLTERARAKVFRELREWACTSAAARESHRFLNVDELRQLAQEEFIEIGAHTVTHPLLDKLPAEEQRDEMRRSKQSLEQTLQRPITSFAYPHGNYASDTLLLARETGFEIACTTRTGVVKAESDLFTLPRVQVQDWAGQEFADWLSHWLYDRTYDFPST